MLRDAVLGIVLRHYLAHAKSSLGSENTTKPTEAILRRSASVKSCTPGPLLDGKRSADRNPPSRESSGRCSVATPPELAGAIFLRQH